MKKAKGNKNEVSAPETSAPVKVSLENQKEANEVNANSSENRAKIFYNAKLAELAAPEYKANLLAIGFSESEATSQIARESNLARAALASLVKEVSQISVRLKSGNPIPLSVANEVSALIAKTISDSFEVVHTNTRQSVIGARVSGGQRGRAKKDSIIEVFAPCAGNCGNKPTIKTGLYRAAPNDFMLSNKIGNKDSAKGLDCEANITVLDRNFHNSIRVHYLPLENSAPKYIIDFAASNDKFAELPQVIPAPEVNHAAPLV